jgi:Flp pilus assembly protein TadD
MLQLHHAPNIAKHGDNRQALELTNQLLDQHPNFIPALKLLGMLLEEAGLQDAASKSYQRGLKLAPNDAVLLYKVGLFDLVAGDIRQAVTLLLHHLRLEPKDEDALYYLAHANHLVGHDELAIKLFKSA